MSLDLSVTGMIALAQSADEREFQPRSTPLLGVAFDDDGRPERLLHEYAGQLVVLVAASADNRAGSIAGHELFPPLWLRPASRYRTEGIAPPRAGDAWRSAPR